MVRMFSRLSLALLLVAGTLLLAACPTRTSIERILRDPGRYAGREVAIGGRVSNSFGALGTGVYQVDDGTGQIWVYSQRYGVPGNGAKVGVKERSRRALASAAAASRSFSGKRSAATSKNRVGADAPVRPGRAQLGRGLDLKIHRDELRSSARTRASGPAWPMVNLEFYWF